MSDATVGNAPANNVGNNRAPTMPAIMPQKKPMPLSRHQYHLSTLETA